MIIINKYPVCNSESLEVIKATRFFPGDRVKDELIDEPVDIEFSGESL